MRKLPIFLIITFGALGCAKQSTPVAQTTQPIAVKSAVSQPPSVHVEQVQVTPESVQKGEQAKIVVRLDKADPDAMVRVNWFDPSGWSVFQAQSAAKSEQMTFIAPAKIFGDPGRYRAEVTSGNVYEGEATVDVTG
jgi:hypothetical protein